MVSSDTSMYTNRIAELEKIVKDQREQLAINDKYITNLRYQLSAGSNTLVMTYCCSFQLKLHY